MKRLISPAILLFLLVSSVYAAPTISSAPETFSHGDPVTISGSGFGIKEPAAPLIWDDFELTVSGVPAEGELLDQSPVGWDVTVGTNNALYAEFPSYSSEVTRSNNSEFSGMMNTPGTQWNSMAYIVGLGHQHEIYASYNFYIDHISGPDSTNMKMMRLIGAEYNGAVHNEYGEPSISVTLGINAFAVNPGSGSYLGLWGITAEKDRWYNWEYYYRASEPIDAPNGEYGFWVDGSMFTEASNVVTMDSGASQLGGEYQYINGIVLPFYASNCDCAYCTPEQCDDPGPNEFKIYYDDVYVDITKARVMLCDSSSWGARSHCEVQIPFSWNDGSIQFTANQGSFGDSTDAFLYVVDEFGEANEFGHSISFGEAPPCVPSAEICNNGTDEDCDSLVDCNDPTCDGNPACPICTPTTEICGDGIDQDCDEEDIMCAICSEGAITERCICGGSIYESGYCCNGTRQASPCAAGRCDESTIISLLGGTGFTLTPLTSSGNLMCGGITSEAAPRILMRGSSGDVSQEFSYEYDSEVSVQNNVIELLPSLDYTISIHNVNNGQSAIQSLQTDSSGNLNFDVEPIGDPPAGTPQINSAPSAITDNSSVTISGINFGTKAQAAPLKWDDFDQPENNPGDVISNWYYLSSPPFYAPHYNSDNSLPGSDKHMRCDFGDMGYGCDFSYDHQATFSPVYLTFWFKRSNPGGIVTDNEKYFRITRTPDDGVGTGPSVGHSFIGTTPGTPTTGVKGGNGGGDWMDAGRWWDTSTYALNTWHRFEGYYVESNPIGAQNGILKEWFQDGGIGNTFDVILDQVIITNEPPSTDHWRGIIFGKYVRRGLTYLAPVPGFHLTHDFDQIYIDNTQARVEISDNPNWLASTHREIQIPSSWSSGSIQFTANQGAFTSGTNLYLFVINADGTVSNGYPVSFS
ncbi:MAG: hypothetical protein ABID38_03090 [Candidatus Diapherotrites archaeon]